MLQIFITGDIMPRMDRLASLKNASNTIFGAMKPYISNADVAIANLEAPVVGEKLTPIKKSGPCLYTSEQTVEVLKEAGFGVVTLANNHFFDQGQLGVENTLKACRENHVDFVGGGRDLDEARKTLTIKINGMRIAFINACEQEFSIANAEHGGSNPIDLIQMQKDITIARELSDCVIVIIHGGVELYPYPTPRMKRWYRHFIDLGADVVINHHQHCMNGYEVYKEKPIFYGLGNFYFPQREGAPKYATWANGYAVMLKLGDKIDYELIPYHQDIDGIVLRDRKEFEREIELLNLPIPDDNLLQQNFDEHIIKVEKTLKSQLLPSMMQGRLLSGLARRGYLGKLYKGKHLYALKNTLTCESHFESLQRVFTLLTKNE